MKAGIGVRPLLAGLLLVVAGTFMALEASAQTISGSVINQSVWSNTPPLAFPPGSGTGTGTVHVGIWGGSSDIAGPPALSTNLATTAALPFPYGQTFPSYVIGGAGLLPDGGYSLVAWIDADDDGIVDYDAGEPSSVAQTVNIVDGVSQIGNTLTITDDADADGLADWWEVNLIGNMDEGGGDDTDKDGLTNREEYDAYRLNGQLLDPANWDTDGDKIDDAWEYTYYAGGSGMNPTVNDALDDADGDGLLNAQEYRGIDGYPVLMDAGDSTAMRHPLDVDPSDDMNPINLDSDGDNLVDSFEAAWYDPANGIDPLAPGNSALDEDQDGLVHYREQCLLVEFRQGAANDIWTSGAGSIPAMGSSGLRAFSPPLTLGATVPQIKNDLVALRANEWTDPSDGSGYPGEFFDRGWDTDGDLLPDGWEVEYDLDPKDSVTANGSGFFSDPDLDGLLNIEEYYGQDGARATLLPYVNGTGDETNPNQHRWSPNSTGQGPGTSRSYLYAAFGPLYWTRFPMSPTDGTLGAAEPTMPAVAAGWDPGLDTDDDGIDDIIEIQSAFASGIPGTSPVHSMHPFVKRSMMVTAASGVIIPDPEGGPANGGYRPLLHQRNWTLECYVKLHTSGLSGHLIDAPGDDPSRTSFRLSLSNDVPSVSFDTIGGSTYTVPGLALSTGVWTHLAGVWDTDANALSLYVDGVFVQQQTVYQSALTEWFYAMDEAPRIGQSDDSSFVGQLGMDEIRIWGVARTQDELEAYRRLLVPPGTAGLLANYRFDDGGTTAEDFARKAQNGLQGAVSPYTFGDHGYALSNGFSFVTNDAAVVRGVSPRGADDSDGDGLPDAWEMINHLDPYSPDGDDGATGDPDGDLLINRYEFWAETNPHATDSDRDGVLDRYEDFDGDTVANLTEQILVSRPDIIDTDDDGLADNEEQSLGTGPANPTDPGVSRAMDFGGAAQDFLLVPASATQRLSAWTLESWVSPTNSGDGVVIRRVVETPLGGDPLVNFELGIEESSGDLLPYASYQPAGGVRYIAYGDPLPVGEEWTHIAGVYNPLTSSITVYIDGMSSGTPLTTAFPAPPASGRGGESFVRIGENFEGRLDHLRVWSIVRTAAEIEETVDTTVPNDSPGLVHYFRFDDGQANEAAFPFGTYHQPQGAQDFVYPTDWNEGWAHAARLNGAVQFVDGGALLVPPSLAVILLPNGALDGGGAWSLNGGPWLESGTVLTDLDADVLEHEIIYKTVAGWTTPDAETVTLTNGVMTVLTRVYLESATLTVNIEPPEICALLESPPNIAWTLDNLYAATCFSTVSNMDAGTHVLDFEELEGWLEPPTENIELEAGANAQVTRMYRRIVGDVQVFIGPPDARDEGARWRIDRGPWLGSGEVVTNLVYGPHTVEYLEIPEWIIPAQATVTIEDFGMLVTTGRYVRIAGLQVDLFPPAAVSNGAKWRLDGAPDWRDTGTFLTLSPGTYIVEYKAIPDWQEPATQDVVVSNETKTLVAAIYSQLEYLGEPGSGAAGEFQRPRGLAINGDYLYVADTDNHRLQRYHMQNGTWEALGSEGSAPGQFRQPMGLAFDSNDDLWVADNLNDRIQRWTPGTGTWTSFGRSGTELGRFNGPFDVIVDDNDRVIVADHYNHRVQAMTTAGAWSVLLDNGIGDGDVRDPGGLWLVSSNSFLVSDRGNTGGEDTEKERIQQVAEDGTFIAKFGSASVTEGGLKRPSGMTVLPGQTLIVADTDNNRVMQRDMSDPFAAWSPVLGASILSGPRDVVADATGNIYIADTLNHRIVKVVAVDTDSDGLTDVQEAQLGTNPAEWDSDMDGYSDGEELDDNTDPNNPLEHRNIIPPKIKQISSRTGRVVLEWDTKPGLVYSLERTPSLGSADWQIVPGNQDLYGDGNPMSYTNTVPSAGSFYKLRVRGRN